MTTKTCTKCAVEKDLDSFHLHKDCKYGRAPECKECKSARSSGHYEKNRTEILNRRRAYKAAHREEIAARDRAYYEANREKRNANSRAYHEANREKLNARKRAYQALIGSPTNKKWQEISLKHATRNGEPWSEEEDHYLANSTARVIDDALALQRSYHSVIGRRSRLRRAGLIEKQYA